MSSWVAPKVSNILSNDDNAVSGKAMTDELENKITVINQSGNKIISMWLEWSSTEQNTLHIKSVSASGEHEYKIPLTFIS